MKRIGITALAIALAGCGARNDLRPAEGQQLPPAPYGASATPAPGDLLQPDPQTRPERNSEILRDSRERESDPFDLPPAG